MIVASGVVEILNAGVVRPHGSDTEFLRPYLQGWGSLCSGELERLATIAA